MASIVATEPEVVTVMGASHALSAVPAWLGACLVAEHLGVHQGPIQIAVGTALCVGGSLLPDIDMAGNVINKRGGATVARSFGRAGLGVAAVAARVSLAVYNLTRTRYDEPRDGAHRTLTHTVPYNLLVGVGTWALTSWGGRWAVLPLVTLLAFVALRALAPCRWRRRSWWAPASGCVSAFCGLSMVPLLPHHGYAFIGTAVGAGCLVHLAGDWITVAGVPLYWPLKVRGKRWWMSRLYPIRAGDRTETRLLRWVFSALACGIFACLVDPHLVAAFGLWLAQSR